MSSFSKCTLDDSWFFYACVQRRSSCTSRWPTSESWVIFLRILNCSNLLAWLFESRRRLGVLQLAILEPWALVFVIRRGLVRSVAWVGSFAEGTWSFVDAVDVIDCLLDDILLAKRRPHSALDAAFDVIRSGFLFFSNMYTRSSS